MKLGGRALKLFLGVAIVAFGVIRYCGSQEENPYTGRTQAISLSTEEEIAIGLQNAPIMAEQHGGLYPDQRLQDQIDAVGKKLVDNTIDTLSIRIPFTQRSQYRECFCFAGRTDLYYIRAL